MVRLNWSIFWTLGIILMAKKEQEENWCLEKTLKTTDGLFEETACLAKSFEQLLEWCYNGNQIATEWQSRCQCQDKTVLAFEPLPISAKGHKYIFGTTNQWKLLAQINKNQVDLELANALDDSELYILILFFSECIEMVQVKNNKHIGSPTALSFSTFLKQTISWKGAHSRGCMKSLSQTTS